MKKLLIAAALVCAAAFANAAQCQWNVTGIAPDNSGTDLTGFKLFLCDSAVVDSATLSANLANGDFSNLSMDGFVQNTAGSVAQGTTGNAKIDSTKNFGDYAIGASKTFYTLILNGDVGTATEFMTTASVSGDVPGTGKLIMTFANVSTSAGASGWQAIPEPTSGLLLLLGIGAMALRRRRA